MRDHRPVKTESQCRTGSSPGLFMNTCCAVRSSCPTGLFSFSLLDNLQVRLCRPSVMFRNGIMSNPD